MKKICIYRTLPTYHTHTRPSPPHEKYFEFYFFLGEKIFLFYFENSKIKRKIGIKLKFFTRYLSFVLFWREGGGRLEIKDKKNEVQHVE